MIVRPFICLFCLTVLPAGAQDLGNTIVPDQPLVVYDSPPTGIFKDPNPIGLLRASGQEVALYGLAPDPKGGFTVGAQRPSHPGDFAIQGIQDVAEGFSTKRWLQIDLGQEAKGQSGWVLCGETDEVNGAADANRACTDFTLTARRY